MMVVKLHKISLKSKHRNIRKYQLKLQQELINFSRMYSKLWSLIQIKRKMQPVLQPASPMLNSRLPKPNLSNLKKTQYP